MDTQPRAHGFRTMWIHDHMHMDTWPSACGYMATCMAIHGMWTWIHSHVHMVTRPVHIAHNPIFFVCWYTETCTWIHDHVNTWPHACGYTATCMRIHGHMHLDARPHAHGHIVMYTWIDGQMYIANNPILHVDTQPIVCGYITTLIHGHVHMDTLLHAHGMDIRQHACGHTATCTWFWSNLMSVSHCCP